jgi:hypothetical protein
MKYCAETPHMRHLLRLVCVELLYHIMACDFRYSSERIKLCCLHGRKLATCVSCGGLIDSCEDLPQCLSGIANFRSSGLVLHSMQHVSIDPAASHAK